MKNATPTQLKEKFWAIVEKRASLKGVNLTIF